MSLILLIKKDNLPADWIFRGVAFHLPRTKVLLIKKPELYKRDSTGRSLKIKSDFAQFLTQRGAVFHSLARDQFQQRLTLENPICEVQHGWDCTPTLSWVFVWDSAHVWVWHRNVDSLFRHVIPPTHAGRPMCGQTASVQRQLCTQTSEPRESIAFFSKPQGERDCVVAVVHRLVLFFFCICICSVIKCPQNEELAARFRNT